MQWASKMFEGASKMVALQPKERRFLVLAWLLAPAVSLVLARGGFDAALKLLAHTAKLPDHRGRRDPDFVSVERAESLVKSAFIRQATARGCLPQSVVQYLLHRRYGPVPRIVIGVARRAAPAPTLDRASWDLDAHAWVEQASGPERDSDFVPILAFSDAGGIWRAQGRS